jgi:flagellar biosynthetic protein FliQ
MTPDFAINLGQQALTITVMLAAPILLSALVVGVLIGMFQAATQINEQTLSFVPKIGVMVLVIFIASPWMLKVLMDFTKRLIMGIPGYLG